MAKTGQVQVVWQAKATLQEATAGLLRQRLHAMALIVSTITVFVFVRDLLLGGTTFVTLRENVALIAVAAFFLLRSRLALSILQLRLIEVLIFGLIAMQSSLVAMSDLVEFARRGDTASAPAAASFLYISWTLLIMGYGMFIPNTWKRAAVILLPAGCVPTIILLTLRAVNEQVVQVLAPNHFRYDFHLAPLVAAVGGIYAAYVMQSIRQEVFEARRFGQYVLGRQLSQGGMGEVYLAEHALLKRPCAIKLIRHEFAQHPMALARFEREVQATARLTHWNTVQIFDYGHTDDGTFYYVMELLTGMSLKELVERHGPLPPERVVHFLEQTCAALHEAHGRGLIHRDLKPANIFAAQVGGVADVAKLLDFGLVKLREPEAAPQATLTQEGKFGGSPLYMAPEQAAAFKDADARCDIYSLGAVAYHLLTGRPPFDGDSPMAIVLAHARELVVAPSRHNAAVPADLERVVLRCLEKKPDQRFPDADQLRQALASCQCAHLWTPDRAEAWWRAHPLIDIIA